MALKDDSETNMKKKTKYIKLTTKINSDQHAKNNKLKKLKPLSWQEQEELLNKLYESYTHSSNITASDMQTNYFKSHRYDCW